MTVDEFNKILEARIVSMRKVLQSKAQEYASDYDRLWNFKRLAAFTSCTPEHALQGCMVKHFGSVLDLIANIDKQNYSRLHLVDEKIGDAINYLVLLEAVIKERLNANSPPVGKPVHEAGNGRGATVKGPKHSMRRSDSKSS